MLEVWLQSAWHKMTPEWIVRVIVNSSMPSQVLDARSGVRSAAAELGRTSRARHGLFLAISRALVEAGAQYTLPPCERLTGDPMHAQRPYGEGQSYLPPFMTKAALKL